MARAVVLSAVRTPIGRYGGALSGVRPDDLAGSRSPRPSSVRGRRRRDRRRLLRLREPGGRGQPQRRAHGRAARRAARVGRGRDAEPALRVRASPRSSPRATRCSPATPEIVVAGGVESMSRAPLVMGEAGRGVPARQPDRLGHDPRLALPEPAARGDVPARVDGRDGRERRRALERVARGSGRVRAALAGALGGGERGGSLRRRARPGRRGRRRRASAPGDDGGGAGEAEARVPAGRHRDRRERERDQRRRRRARDRERGEGRESSGSSRSARSSARRSRASIRA